MQNDSDEALDALYQLREHWAKRSGADAQTILKAIGSLIAEYEAARGASEEGLP